MHFDDFTWHENALKGIRGPISADEPMSGFYRQKNRAGQYEPVAYWRDTNTGEQRCHINGKSPADPLRMFEVWPHASRHPISEEAYWHRMDTGEWLDNDAGAAAAAKGPEIDPETDPAGSLAAEIAAAKAGLAAYASIDSDEQSAKAQTLRSALTGLSGKATKAYEALNRPLLNEQQRIRKVWFPLRDEAADAADKLRKAMGAWEDIKLENAKRAAEETAKKQAEAAREAEWKGAEPGSVAPVEPPTVAPVVPNTPPPSTKIKGASGRAASVQLKKVVTAIDIDKAFAQFRDDPELYAFLMDLSQRVVTAGFVAIGATIEEKSDIR
jgi:hypothetical protein